ncbi:MAG: hypothetical protein M1546_16255 [Chloroflexi bacterium]|nr:hypothetical protein [Chloroflexota bacterium]
MSSNGNGNHERPVNWTVVLCVLVLVCGWGVVQFVSNAFTSLDESTRSVLLTAILFASALVLALLVVVAMLVRRVSSQAQAPMMPMGMTMQPGYQQLPPGQAWPQLTAHANIYEDQDDGGFNVAEN